VEVLLVVVLATVVVLALLVAEKVVLELQIEAVVGGLVKVSLAVEIMALAGPAVQE
jgi:hypothetical protein